MELNTYGYPNDVGLITKCDQMMSAITKVIKEKETASKEVIKEAVTESIEPLDGRFDEINANIENAKNEILEHEGDTSGCCGCCKLATKADIQRVIDEINDKFININDYIND
jgi:hypothetical protein